MQRPKAIATAVALTLLATASAVALNVSVIQATQTATSGGDPEPTTVVVDVPAGSDEVGMAPVVVAGIEASVPQTTVPATAVVVSAPPTTTAPPPAVPSTTAASAPAPASSTAPTTTAATTTSGTTEYLTFSAGPAGEVVVAVHGGRSLEFWTAYPTNGWHYKVEKAAGTAVEVKYFKQGAGEGKLIVELEGGAVRTQTEGFAGAGGGDDDDD